MIALKNLINCTLEKAEKVKQKNGTMILTYNKVDDYRICVNELDDQVSATVYGANINKVYRVYSPRKRLENFIKTKNNSTDDNISKYYLNIDGVRYKIVSSKNNHIDIEL